MSGCVSEVRVRGAGTGYLPRSELAPDLAADLVLNQAPIGYVVRERAKGAGGTGAANRCAPTHCTYTPYPQRTRTSDTHTTIAPAPRKRTGDAYPPFAPTGRTSRGGTRDKSCFTFSESR